MQPRCCRYFLLSVLLIQSFVIVWLVRDMSATSSSSSSYHESSLVDAKAIFERQGQLTVRDLQVIEDPNTREEVTQSGPPSKSPETTVREQATSHETPSTKKEKATPSKSPPSSNKSPSEKSPSEKSPSTHSSQNASQGGYWLAGGEELIEKIQRPSRTLSEFELAGNNIMITIRTTRKFHQKRLPYMYDTWLNKVNGSNVFLVTDAEDEEYQEKSKKLGTGPYL